MTRLSETYRRRDREAKALWREQPGVREKLREKAAEYRETHREQIRERDRAAARRRRANRQQG